MIFTRIKFVLVYLSIIAILTGIAMQLSPYLFPLRSPIIFGLVILLFPIVANIAAKTLFQNLFALDNVWQIGSVIVGAAMSAFMVSFEAQQFLGHAFGLSSLIHISNVQLLEIIGVLVLPTLIFVFWRSSYEIKKNSIVLGFLGGAIVSTTFIYFNFYLSSLLNTLPLAQFSIFDLFPDIREFITQNREDFCLGLSLWVCGCLVYGLTIYLYKPRSEARRIFSFLNHAPVLLYVYLLTWIWSGLFGFFTFFLDRYHIPVTLCAIALSALMYFAFDVDHFYKVVRIEQDKLTHNDHPDQMRNFEQALKQRLSKQPNSEKTLVVVAASGGGIQAAGWTAQVLCGLQQELGERFTQSIGLISSVSGGSVGAMNFIDWFDLERGCPKGDESLNTIFDNSTQDNLDAVGWGLAGPDFARFIGFPWLAFGKYNDRGYAIEDDWKVNMKHKSNYRLSNWREQILQGQIPIPVFNATLVEDGKRYLISPMTFLKNIQDADTKKAFDFNTLFNSESSIYDLNVTTAARLSASFPYVSPISRNDGNFKFNYHVTDGGYFDNSGMFTVIEWINEHSEMLVTDLRIKQIILIQINASPDEPKLEEQKGDKGWFMEWLGPLQAIYTVRDSTLMSRNSREVELLDKSKTNIEIDHFVFSFPSDDDFKHKVEQPLSWKLTKKQKENLKKGWEITKDTEPYQKLKILWSKL